MPLKEAILTKQKLEDPQQIEIDYPGYWRGTDLLERHNWQCRFNEKEIASLEKFLEKDHKLSDQESWDSQLSLWQSHIEKLVQEYAQGDSRLFIGNLDEAKRTFAPLTRVYEQAALLEHSIDGESSDQ